MSTKLVILALLGAFVASANSRAAKNYNCDFCQYTEETGETPYKVLRLLGRELGSALTENEKADLLVHPLDLETAEHNWRTYCRINCAKKHGDSETRGAPKTASPAASELQNGAGPGTAAPAGNTRLRRDTEDDAFASASSRGAASAGAVSGGSGAAGSGAAGRGAASGAASSRGSASAGAVSGGSGAAGSGAAGRGAASGAASSRGSASAGAVSGGSGAAGSGAAGRDEGI